MQEFDTCHTDVNVFVFLENKMQYQQASRISVQCNTGVPIDLQNNLHLIQVKNFGLCLTGLVTLVLHIKTPRFFHNIFNAVRSPFKLRFPHILKYHVDL